MRAKVCDRDGETESFESARGFDATECHTSLKRGVNESGLIFMFIFEERVAGGYDRERHIGKSTDGPDWLKLEIGDLRLFHNVCEFLRGALHYETA